LSNGFRPAMMPAMTTERDYVLGTHDEEVARLAMQHRVWRPKVLDAWQRAGFRPGQTLIDVGCGPGAATVDLAEIVGPTGRVVAIDRSRRFLDVVESHRARRGLEHIRTFELDLDHAALPAVAADGAWVRWVFAFVKDPRDLAARVREALRPGGMLVIYEYLDYSTWRTAPRSPEHEAFVAEVMASWRASGGEPDVGLDLPRWLAELGFELCSLRPIMEIVPPSSPWWEWPKVFQDVGLQRLVDLGQVTPERAAEMARAFAASEADPRTLMIMPAVIEIIARRP
jgi:SAM-dependent methyltransferase